MRRRTFLAALTGAGAPTLAGCSTFGSDPSPTITPASVPADPVDTSVPRSARPQTMPEEPFARSSHVVFNTVGLRASLFPMRSRTSHGLVVAWFLTHDSAESPARIAVRFVNPTTTTRRYVLRRPAPLGTAFLDGDADLVLVPTPAHPDVEDAPPIARGPPRVLAADCTARAVRNDGRVHPASGFERRRWIRARCRRGERLSARGYQHGSGRPQILRGAVGLRPSWPDPVLRFSTVTVPLLPLPNATDWFHEADRTTPLYLEPSAERVDLPGTVTFTLVNRSRLPLSGNPSGWALWKLTDRRWRRVAPTTTTDDVRWIPIGASERWFVRLRDGAPNESTDVDVGHLEGGRYAFVVPYGRRRRQTAAFIDLDVPALTISPRFRSGPERR